MGPRTLFDKSFLQGLNVNEAVWFDRFYVAVICPLFYRETLADLAKAGSRRSGEEEVRIIAEKVPDLAGMPCSRHTEAASQDLLGNEIPMDGRVPREGGKTVQTERGTAIVWNDSPEERAFRRWQDGEFNRIEKSWAEGYRKELEEKDTARVAMRLREQGVTPRSCKSLESAKELADELIWSKDSAFEWLGLAVRLLGIAARYHRPVIDRWHQNGRPRLGELAPYAAHVLTIEIFFHIAVAAGLIAPERRSNRTDIEYLFYLPFCMLFVSTDKLHRRTAPLFLRSNQEFIWGEELKADLGRLNTHYSSLSSSVKQRGVLYVAPGPPVEGGHLTTKLWNKWCTGWDATAEGGTTRQEPRTDKKLAEEIETFSKAPALPEQRARDIGADTDAMIIQRAPKRRKGDWVIVPERTSHKMMDATDKGR